MLRSKLIFMEDVKKYICTLLQKGKGKGLNMAGGCMLFLGIIGIISLIITQNGNFFLIAVFLITAIIVWKKF